MSSYSSSYPRNPRCSAVGMRLIGRPRMSNRTSFSATPRTRDFGASASRSKEEEEEPLSSCKF
eukprot:3913415-Rhodomonas_salina.1